MTKTRIAYYFLIVDDSSGEISTALGHDEQGRDVVIPAGCSLYDCLPYYSENQAYEAWMSDQIEQAKHEAKEDDRLFESTRKADYYREPFDYENDSRYDDSQELIITQPVALYPSWKLESYGDRVQWMSDQVNLALENYDVPFSVYEDEAKTLELYHPAYPVLRYADDVQSLYEQQSYNDSKIDDLPPWYENMELYRKIFFTMIYIRAYHKFVTLPKLHGINQN